MFDESNLFQGLDIASAADDPWSVAPDVYNAVVGEVKIETKEATPDKEASSAFVLIYVIDQPESTYHGRKVREYQGLPPRKPFDDYTPEEKDRLSYVKSRLLSLGVPPERVNTVKHDDLIGVRVVITVVKNGEYTNVRKVVLRDGNGVIPSPGSIAASNPYLTGDRDE